MACLRAARPAGSRWPSVTPTDVPADVDAAGFAPTRRREELAALLDRPVAALLIGGLAWLAWSAIYIAADALGAFSDQYRFGIGASMAIIYLPFMVAAPVAIAVLLIQWIGNVAHRRPGRWLLAVPIAWSAVLVVVLVRT